MPAHLSHRDIAIPVRDGARVGLKVDSGQPKRRRQYQGRALPIDVEPRIVEAGSPRLVNSFGIFRDGWGSGDDLARIEVEIWPAVEPSANARRKRIVHSGVAQS